MFGVIIFAKKVNNGTDQIAGTYMVAQRLVPSVEFWFL